MRLVDERMCWNGVLKLTLPKSEDTGRRFIAVQ